MRQMRSFRPNKANKWFVCNVPRNEEAKFWSGRSEMRGAGVWGRAAWRNWACEANADVNLMLDVRVLCRAAPLWMVSGWA
jgi:hypothetical protein